MKLKGIELKGTYKVNFYDMYFEVYNERNNPIFIEHSKGSWSKSEYDELGQQIYREYSDGYWYKKEYDEKGNQIYFEDSDGYWVKSEYNEKGNQIYFENSNGEIVDKRIKELTIEEIEKLLGYKIKIKG